MAIELQMKMLLTLSMFSFCFSVFGQKSIIQNGNFEDNGNIIIPKGYYTKMAESVEYWSSYSHGTSEIGKWNNFIVKKDRSLCIAACPIDTAWFRGGSDNCLGIDEGKYSTRFSTFNLEHSFTPHDGIKRQNTISYIINELAKYRKEGDYKLQFSGVINNGGLNNPFFNHFYESKRKSIQERIDMIKYGKPCPENQVPLNLSDTINEIPNWWNCEPSEKNKLKTTILFTNTLPEGKLYEPQEGDVYLDTLLETDCEKGWTEYSFEFELKERYDYFVIGYLPRELRKDSTLCPGSISFALDDFNLTHLKK